MISEVEIRTNERIRLVGRGMKHDTRNTTIKSEVAGLCQKNFWQESFLASGMTNSKVTELIFRLVPFIERTLPDKKKGEEIELLDINSNSTRYYGIRDKLYEACELLNHGEDRFQVNLISTSADKNNLRSLRLIAVVK